MIPQFVAERGGEAGLPDTLPFQSRPKDLNGRGGTKRCMLFSVDGNVISTNAPRPSSDEIRELLNANLGGLPNL